jgi:hypothetical protein
MGLDGGGLCVCISVKCISKGMCSAWRYTIVCMSVCLSLHLSAVCARKCRKGVVERGENSVFSP